MDREREVAVGLGKSVQRLAHPRRGAGNGNVEADLAVLQFLAHPPCRLPAAWAERTVEVVGVGHVPARLGVSQEGQALHSTVSSTARCRAPTASRSCTRAIATSSGTRLMATP